MKKKKIMALLGVFLLVITVSFSVWAETEELLILQKIEDVATETQALGIQPIKSTTVENMYSATVTDFIYGTTPIGNVSVRSVSSEDTINIFQTIQSVTINIGGIVKNFNP